MNSNIISLVTDFSAVIISALIFVISFLWKDLLVDIEQIYFPKRKGIFNRIIYILVVTLIILSIISYLRKIFKMDDVYKFDDSPIDDNNNIPDTNME